MNDIRKLWSVCFTSILLLMLLIPFLLQSVYNLSKKRGGAKWQGHQREKNF